MTPFEMTLIVHRQAVARQYTILWLKYLGAAVVMVGIVYFGLDLTDSLMPAIGMIFAVCAIGWIHSTQEADYERRYVMPDSWFAILAETKGIPKDTLARVRELVKHSGLVTLDDADHVALYDRQQCLISGAAQRPGVRALFARK